VTQIAQWTESAQSPILPAGTVHVWAWLHGDSVSLPEPDISSLGPDELLRYRRFLFRADQLRFAVSHINMRAILAGYRRESPAVLVLSAGAGGKPRLVCDEEPALEFNLSHSRNVGLLAVARHLELGVDVEEFRPVEPGLPERYFSASEIQDLSPLKGDEWLSGFLRCWTRKEAVLKAEGVGLRIPLDAFDVSLKAEDPPMLRGVRPPAAFRFPWQLYDVSPRSDAIAALAVSAAPADLHLFHYRTT
jgi:4'-phosphopantetheinyl transferase